MSLNTVVACLRKGDEQGAWNEFYLVPEDDQTIQFDRINAIMLASRSSPGRAAAQAGYKRQAMHAALPDLLQWQWDALCACNKPEAQNEALFLRAKARAIETFLTAPLSRLEKNPRLSEIIFSHLDVPDLAHLSCCSANLNYQLSKPNPRVWKAAASTFALQDKHWPVYSRSQARANFHLLKRVNQTFQVWKSEPLVQGTLALANEWYSQRARGQPFNSRVNSDFQTTQQRRNFKETTLPTVSLFHQGGPDMTNFFLETDRGLFSRISVDAFTEMMFACGGYGDENTLLLAAKLIVRLARGGFDVLNISSVAPGVHKIRHRCENKAMIEKEFAALERIADECVPPKIFGGWDPARFAGAPAYMRIDLSILMANVSKERREAFFLKLLEKGMKINKDSWSTLQVGGPIDLLKLALKHGKDELRTPNTTLVSLLIGDLYNLKFAPGMYNVGSILEAIDLLYQKDQPLPEASCLVFDRVAKLGSVELMNKIVSMGMGPNNSESRENTLYRALTSENGVLSREKQPLHVIALMVKFGARASKEAVQAVSAYSNNHEINCQLADIISRALPGNRS